MKSLSKTTMALLFILIFSLSTTFVLGGSALNITFVDSVTYNVTYNATDESETPNDLVVNPSTYIKDISGQLTILNTANEDLADVNVTIINTAQLKNLPVYAPLYSDVTGYVHNEGWSAASGGSIIFHIPDLPSGEKVVYNYSVEQSEIVEPLNITKNTTTPLAQGRVFTNTTFNVSINVSMRFGDPSTRVLFNAWEHGMNEFTFRNDTGFMNPSEGTNATIDNDTITWNNVELNGVNDSAMWNIAVHSALRMPPGATAVENASYNVKKNYLPVIFGRLELNLTANDTVWDVEIAKVDAKPKGRISVAKRRADAFDWTIHPRFRNTAITPKIYVQLNKMSVWAIPSLNDGGDLDLGNKTKWMPNSYFQWNESSDGDYFPAILALGEEWVNDSSQNDGLGIGHTFFNDTVVPIVWGKANFTLVDNDTTVSRIYQTINKSEQYVYYQKVMLLQGYFLEAEKSVEDLNGQGMYRIIIELTNRGNSRTPNSTLLADLIPANMNITDDTGTITDDGIEINSTDGTKDYTKQGDQNGILWSRYSGSQNFTGKSSATGDFSGFTTYYWEMKLLEPQEKITIVYYINGTEDYYPGDMYVVGVDPVQANRIGASRRIFSSDGLYVPENTSETYAVPLSLGLLALGMFSVRKKRKTPVKKK